MIVELQREIYAVNCEKGWHQEPLREPPVLPGRPAPGPAARVHTDRVLAKLALIHTELVEAEVESSGARHDVYYYADHPDWAGADNCKDPHKPEGWIIELADVVIRCLDTCAALGLTLSLDSYPLDVSAHDTRVWHHYVAAATEAARRDDYFDFARALGGLCADIEHDVKVQLLEGSISLDLWDAVRLKLVYNMTRSYRHGGKKA